MFDMLGSIIKNLTSKPATRNYPFEKREPYKDSRGQVGGIDIDTCIFCGICARKCPSNAIIVNRAEKLWEIDKYQCIVCGVCAEVCPKKSIYMDAAHKTSSYEKATERYVQKPMAKEA